MNIEKVGGTKGAIVGGGLESLILITNRCYENKRLGTVKKNHVQKKFAGGKFFHSEKSTVDFDGFLSGIGFVAFDCKSTNEKCWRPDRAQLHQWLYLYRGQLQMDPRQARFFYLIERRWCEDKTGVLRNKSQVYLVENLEDIKQTGKYEFRDADVVTDGPGILLDYRAALLRGMP